MDLITQQPTAVQDITSTEKPYSRYGDGEFLIYLLPFLFTLIFIAAMINLAKWCRTQECRTSQSQSLSSNNAAYESFAPQPQFPNSVHLPEELLQELPREAQTRVQYPNSLHLPVELLHERSRSNSTPFPNSSINFPRITVGEPQIDSNPPTYERSFHLSTQNTEQADRARSRSVTNIPAPHHRNLQNQFPTSTITFPSTQPQSVSTPPPTYDEVLRSFAL